MPPPPVGQPFQIVGPRQEGAQKVQEAAAESEACRFGWNPLKNLSCGFRRGVEAGRRLAPHIKKYIPGYSTSDVIDILSPNEADPAPSASMSVRQMPDGSRAVPVYTADTPREAQIMRERQSIGTMSSKRGARFIPVQNLVPAYVSSPGANSTTGAPRPVGTQWDYPSDARLAPGTAVVSPTQARKARLEAVRLRAVRAHATGAAW